MIGPSMETIAARRAAHRDRVIAHGLAVKLTKDEAEQVMVDYERKCSQQGRVLSYYTAACLMTAKAIELGRS